MFKSTIANAQKEVEVIKKDEGYYLMDLEKVGETISSGWLTNSTIELIEDQTIDIDSIQEIELSEYDREHYVAPIRNNADKINEVISALKHLNKEIQSIKKIDGTDTNVRRKEK